MENEDLEKAISQTEPVIFNYWTYQLARLTVCFSCCKGASWAKNAMRSKNLQDMALDEINNEIDISRLIKASRVAALMTKMFLKPN
jgi:hypothetical protein